MTRVLCKVAQVELWDIMMALGEHRLTLKETARTLKLGRASRTLGPTRGAPLPTGLQKHQPVERHGADNSKPLAYCLDALVPLLSACGRVLVAREIHVGQERINLPNLPQEIQVRQPVRRLVQSAEPISVSVYPEPCLRPRK
jgi:hypothetical protein